MCTHRELCSAAEHAMKSAAGITSTRRLAHIGIVNALAQGDVITPVFEQIVVDHAGPIARQHRFVLRTLPEAKAISVIAHGLRAIGEDAEGSSFTVLLMESMNEVQPLPPGPEFLGRLLLAEHYTRF